MKRARTFQTSATDDAVAIQKTLVLIKAHTASSWLLEAHQGKPLFYNRQDMKDLDMLVKEIVSFDPYIKKSTLEEALIHLDNENSKKLSASSPSQGFWAKQEGFVLKDLVMKSIKKAHNSCRWTRPRNMDTVVQALLDRRDGDSQRDGDSLGSPLPEPACTGSTFLQRHRRLVRRRSSDTDVVCVSGPPPVQPGPDQQDTKAEIYALYGVTDSSCNTKSEMQDQTPADLVDLTMSPSPKKNKSGPVAETTPRGRSKMYFDMSKNTVVRAFTDGSLEEARTEEGPDGFLIGVFADGTIYNTEIPNVTKGLPTRKSIKEEDDKKRKLKRNKKTIAKAKAKAEAKTKGNAKAKAQAKPKAKTKAKAKAKAKMDNKEDGGPTASEIEKGHFQEEGLELAAQEDAKEVGDQSMHWRHVLHMWVSEHVVHMQPSAPNAQCHECVWCVVSHACTMQDPEIIKDIKIVRAKDRTYIQGFWGNPRGKHLVVEISEKQSPDHRELIEQIGNHISAGCMTKALALQMRADLLKAKSG